jgi:hypothetical protein
MALGIEESSLTFHWLHIDAEAMACRNPGSGRHQLHLNTDDLIRGLEGRPID